MAAAASPLREQPIECEQGPEHHEDPELDQLDDVLRASLEAHADVLAPDAEHDRRHEHRDEAVALGRQLRERVCAEADARARRAPSGAADLVPEHARAGQQHRPPAARPPARSRSPRRGPEARTPTTRSRVVGGQRGRERQHGRQRQPVVQTRLQVQRVADQARNPRVGHHSGREHRVGRRQQRAEEEGLRPGQIGERLGGQRHEGAPSTASPAPACAAAAAMRAGASPPPPRARRGTGSGSAPRPPASSRSPTRGRTPISRDPPPPARSRLPRRGLSATGSCGAPLRRRARRRPAARPAPRRPRRTGSSRRRVRDPCAPSLSALSEGRQAASPLDDTGRAEPGPPGERRWVGHRVRRLHTFRPPGRRFVLSLPTGLACVRRSDTRRACEAPLPSP